MGRRRELLRNVTGKARRRRAEWIVALAELQRSGRAWCTLGEWLETWPSEDRRERSPGAREVAAKAQRARLRKALRAIRIKLRERTPEGEGLQIGVGTPELRALVALELEEAQRALAAGDGGSFGPASCPTPEEIVRDYWMFRASLERVARSRRVHHRVIRAVVRAARKPIRLRGAPTIEHLRPPEIVARARKAVLAAESVSELARILGCSRHGARTFRRRVLQTA